MDAAEPISSGTPTSSHGDPARDTRCVGHVVLHQADELSELVEVKVGVAPFRCEGGHMVHHRTCDPAPRKVRQSRV